MTKARTTIALLLGLLVGYWVQPQGLAAQNPNRAALVVRAGDQQVQTACVEFSETEITGLDLLLRSGLDVQIEAQGLGALVCSIDGTGCSADDCWCQCSGGGECIYWSYWLHDNGSWTYSQAGAMMTRINDGSIQGWSWGPGSVSAAIPPPATTFEEVCEAEQNDEPTATPRPAIVVTPGPTAVPATAVPTQTAQPTSTSLPPTVTPAQTAVPTPTPQTDRTIVTVTANPAQPAEPTLPPPTAVPTTPESSLLPAGALPQTAAPAATQPPPGPALSGEELVAGRATPPPQTAQAPERLEPERAKIAAAPTAVVPQALTVVGAGVAAPAPAAPLLPDDQETSGMLSYLVFLLLAGSLAAFLLYARLRTAEQ